ncbi:MAG: Lrp/AsnC family transcriptional regulator [Thermoplasmata archaeon]|nr:MAG: Lrp/AsnC family transcriptional regulator [Thermoplasmata archaeon]
MKLDTKDRTIISMYAKNPNVSQEEIAKEIKLSQPSVAMRIKKLRESGAIETQTGINPLKMGLYVAKVDISSNNPMEILGMFKNCPYFANGFSISGKHNLSLFFVSESIATLEAIINGHVRPNKSVTDVDFNIVIATEKDFIVPSVLTPEKSEDPPSGSRIKCRNCPA